MDSRKYTRYQIGAPVVFRCLGPSSNSWEGEGITRDISTVGIYVLASKCPAMKSTASIEITLPPVQTGMVALKLHVQGQVVRVDSEDDELIGFAISSDTIVLCDGAKHNVVEYTRMLTIR